MPDNTIHDRPTFAFALGITQPEGSPSVPDATGYSDELAVEQPRPSNERAIGERSE